MAARDRIYFRVAKGALTPADPYAASRLRERGYNIGDLLAATLTKPRNPKFNRLVHRIGQLVVANIDAFAGMDAHKAIKRLQLESGVACEEVGISMASAWDAFSQALLSLPGTAHLAPALGVVGALLPAKHLLIIKIPRSLSFESLDEGEYKDAARGICRWISSHYWNGLTPEQIELMAESMIEE